MYCVFFFYLFNIKYGYIIWLWNLSRKGDERIDWWIIIGIYYGFVSYVFVDINELNLIIIF